MAPESRTRTSRSAMLIAAAAVSLVARDGRGSPPDTYGLGARSTALGGAVSASASDYSAGYYNPAGLARRTGSELSLGYLHVSHHLELDRHDSMVDPVGGFVGGLVARGAVAEVPLAVGLTAHVSDERLSRLRTRRPEEPYWVRYDDRPQLLYLSLSAAVRPISWATLGGGVAMLAATRGEFRVTGTAVQPDGRDRSETDSQLRHEVDVDLTVQRYPIFGVVVTPADWVAWAVVYRGEATVDFEVEGELSGEVETVAFSVPAAYEVASRSTSAFIPRQLVVGLWLEPLKPLEVEVDLTYLNWSAYESPFSRTDSELDVRAPAGLLDLPPDARPSLKLDPHFRDRVVPRVGVQYVLEPDRALTVPLRAGYAFEKSPVPAQTRQSNFVDTDRHLLSVGSGIVWKDPAPWLPGKLRLDCFGQYSLLPTRVTLKSSPADFVGDYRARGEIFAVGADLSLELR